MTGPDPRTRAVPGDNHPPRCAPRPGAVRALPGKGQVVVIGGGLAGIAAALGAADGGASVTVVERRRRLGGLTWSFCRNGHRFDNGQHVFLRCCTAYRGLLDRIGGTGQVVLQDRMRIPVLARGGRRADLWRTGWPAPLHLLRSLAGYSHLSRGERLGVARAVLALRRLDREDRSLDDRTFGSWLADHGQGEGAVERLWDLLTVPTVNLPAAEASLALAVTVFQVGLLDSSDAGDVGWSEVPLSTLHGENATRALEAAGAEVRTGVRVTRVRTCGSGRPGGSGCSDGSGRPGGSGWLVEIEGEGAVRADMVIVATPPEVAAALIGPGVLPGVERLGRSPIVNVHLVFDRTVTDLPMAAAVGSPVQFVFDRTESAGVTGGQCLAVSLSAADRWIGLRPKALVDTVTEAVGDLLPAAAAATVTDAVVTRERSATFRGVPGTAGLRPGPVTSLDGLFVAGAWCATGWPATMEGAVRSGQAAAAAALARLGSEPDRFVPTPPSLEEVIA